jgi:glutamyl-tRNA reductase
LRAVADQNLDLRKQEVGAAERIIEEDVARYGEWLRSLQALPTVAAISARAEEIRAAELERTLARLDLPAEVRERMDAMTSALVKKLLHGPLTRLKSQGEGERYVAAARALFGLDDAAAVDDETVAEEDA